MTNEFADVIFFSSPVPNYRIHKRCSSPVDLSLTLDEVSISWTQMVHTVFNIKVHLGVNMPSTLKLRFWKIIRNLTVH